MRRPTRTRDDYLQPSPGRRGGVLEQ
jgi:hypothetical protein